MIQSKTVDAGAVALLAAAMVMPIAATEHAGDRFSVDVALTTAASPADAFDLTGLLQAEVKAGEGLFNAVFGFPGALIGDVVNPVETAITDAAALNFGEAFSAVAGIPVGVANTVIDLPIGLVEGLYSMVAVIPGQYLFNFGAPDVATPGGATTAVTTDPGTVAGSAAAAAPDASDPSDPSDPVATGGPYFLNFQGLAIADMADLMRMAFGPLNIYASTATMIAETNFFPAIQDVFHGDLTAAVTSLSAGFEGEGELLTSTLTPYFTDTADIVALNPAYYLLDFDPFSLLQSQ